MKVVMPNANRNKPVSSSARSPRRRAREFALQGVYAWLVHGDPTDTAGGDIQAHLRDNDSFVQADTEWFQTLLEGVTLNADNLRVQFSPFVDRPLEELSPVEHAILLMGSYELIHHIEVPYRVAINESVELAKTYGGTDGFKFVNGVLDKLAAQVRATEVQQSPRR
jgi:N utilization substance protein B